MNFQGGGGNQSFSCRRAFQVERISCLFSLVDASLWVTSSWDRIAAFPLSKKLQWWMGGSKENLGYCQGIIEMKTFYMCIVGFYNHSH